ncbi:hypothetical protein D3C76_795250 [compost metagenome]
MGQQRRHVPAFDEVHAVGDAQLVGNAPGDALVIDDTGGQRMVLHHQPRIAAGMAGERAHHVLEHILHVAERRVIADLRIAVQLQGQQEGAVTIARHLTDHLGIATLGIEQANALANVARILHRRVERRVGLVMGEHHFVQRAADVIHHVVQGPGGKGQAKCIAVVITRDVLAHLPIPLRIPGQQRVIVHAVALKGDPVGAEVAFLEHVHADPQRLGQRHRRLMHWTAVAEQHHVGDVLRLEAVAVEIRQLLGARRIKLQRTAAVQGIAHVETDGLDPLSFVAQGLGQAREKRRTDALQKQKRVARLDRHRTQRALTGN